MIGDDVKGRRRELRATLDAWAGGCEWPGCDNNWRTLEMAHVEGVGMGGRASADRLDNVALLCNFHHNLLDGRTHLELRTEMAKLLAGYLEQGWRRAIDD